MSSVRHEKTSPVFGVSDLVLHKQGCTATEDFAYEKITFAHYAALNKVFFFRVSNIAIGFDSDKPMMIETRDITCTVMALQKVVILGVSLHNKDLVNSTGRHLVLRMNLNAICDSRLCKVSVSQLKTLV